MRNSGKYKTRVLLAKCSYSRIYLIPPVHDSPEPTVISKKARTEISGKKKFSGFMLWAKCMRNQLEEKSPGIDFATTKSL